MHSILPSLALEVDLLEDKAYEVLKEAIVSLRLQPKQRLLERGLVEQLEISKTPITRALVRLRREGFVEQVARKGTFVSPVTTRTVYEISQLRQALEGFAMRQALPCLGDGDIEKLRRCSEEAAEALRDNKMDLYAKYNEEFHRQVVEAVGNSRLLAVWTNANEHFRRIRLIWGRSRSEDEVPRILELFHEQHVKMLEAAARGDEATAARLMVGHISAFGNWVIRDAKAGRIPLLDVMEYAAIAHGEEVVEEGGWIAGENGGQIH
jgi:DNA-binding GntR family transcriptional regulator